MNRKTTNIILLGMLAGVLFGGLLGYYWPQGLLATEFIGVLFLNALKVIIIPLIVASMIVGVTAMGDVRKVGRVGVKVIVYFLATTTIAVAIGLILVNLFNPGEGVSPLGAAISQGMAGAQERSITDIIVALIPSNLISAMADGKYLGIIIFSLVFGGVLTTLGPKAKTMISFFRELNEVIMKMVFLILYTAPIGLFSVVGTIVAKNSDSVSELSHSLFWYGLTLVVGLLIHGFIVLPLILRYFSGRSPLEYATNMLPAFATAIGTSSSSATLPVTYECVVDKNKVDPRAGQFVLPLGTTVNMDGTAMYVVIATIFVAQVYHVPLGFFDMIMIGITAVLVSIGAAGIPSAALFMLAIVFGVAGFPPEAYAGVGLILAVDWFLDRCRTTVNVWGDSVGAAVIAESFEFKTARRTVARKPSDRYQRTSTSSRGQSGSRTSSSARSTSSSRTTGSARSERSSRTSRSTSSTPATSTTRPERSERGPRTNRSTGSTRTTGSARTTADSRTSRTRPTQRDAFVRGERDEGRVTHSENPKPEVSKSNSSPFEITEPGAPIFNRESGSLTTSTSYEKTEKSVRPSRTKYPSSSTNSKREESKTDDSAVSTDRPVSEKPISDSRPRPSRVSASAAARDLAKLSAQLGKDKNEKTVTTRTSAPKVTEVSRASAPTPPKSSEIQAPKKSVATTAVPVSPPDSSSEPTPAVSSSTAPSAPSSFGRTRTRKGMAPSSKPETKATDKKPERDEQKADFDSEGISFGRNRRKRSH